MSLFKKIKTFYEYLFDKDVLFPKKILIILVFIYILSPLDIIPDPILGLGIIDDIIILLIAYNLYKRELKKYAHQKEKSKNKTDIIYNVDYIIKDKEDV